MKNDIGDVKHMRKGNYDYNDKYEAEQKMCEDKINIRLDTVFNIIKNKGKAFTVPKKMFYHSAIYTCVIERKHQYHDDFNITSLDHIDELCSLFIVYCDLDLNVNQKSIIIAKAILRSYYLKEIIVPDDDHSARFCLNSIKINSHMYESLKYTSKGDRIHISTSGDSLSDDNSIMKFIDTQFEYVPAHVYIDGNKYITYDKPGMIILNLEVEKTIIDESAVIENNNLVNKIIDRLKELIG